MPLSALPFCTAAADAGRADGGSTVVGGDGGGCGGSIMGGLGGAMVGAGGIILFPPMRPIPNGSEELLFCMIGAGGIPLLPPIGPAPNVSERLLFCAAAVDAGRAGDSAIVGHDGGGCDESIVGGGGGAMVGAGGLPQLPPIGPAPNRSESGGAGGAIDGAGTKGAMVSILLA